MTSGASFSGISRGCGGEGAGGQGGWNKQEPLAVVVSSTGAGHCHITVIEKQGRDET